MKNFDTLLDEQMEDPEFRIYVRLLEEGRRAAEAERDALAARLAAVEALAEHYEAEARSEGYGGELWSTTGAAIRAALATGATTNQQEADQ